MKVHTEQGINDIFEMLQSLHDSMLKVGGCPATIENLKATTAWDFISMLAPNRVRFTVIPEKTEVIKQTGRVCPFCKHALAKYPNGSWCCQNVNCP